MTVHEAVIGPQNYFEGDYTLGDYTHPGIARFRLNCDINGTYGGVVVTGEYYEGSYIDGTYFHANQIEATLTVTLGQVIEATVSLSGYAAEDYFAEDYTQAKGGEASVVANVGVLKNVDTLLTGVVALDTQPQRTRGIEAVCNSTFVTSVLPGLAQTFSAEPTTQASVVTQASFIADIGAQLEFAADLQAQAQLGNVVDSVVVASTVCDPAQIARVTPVLESFVYANAQASEIVQLSASVASDFGISANTRTIQLVEVAPTLSVDTTVYAKPIGFTGYQPRIKTTEPLSFVSGKYGQALKFDTGGELAIEHELDTMTVGSLVFWARIPSGTDLKINLINDAQGENAEFDLGSTQLRGNWWKDYPQDYTASSDWVKWIIRFDKNALVGRKVRVLRDYTELYDDRIYQTAYDADGKTLANRILISGTGEIDGLHVTSSSGGYRSHEESRPETIANLWLDGDFYTLKYGLDANAQLVSEFVIDTQTRNLARRSANLSIESSLSASVRHKYPRAGASLESSLTADNTRVRFNTANLDTVLDTSVQAKSVITTTARATVHPDFDVNAGLIRVKISDAHLESAFNTSITTRQNKGIIASTTASTGISASASIIPNAIVSLVNFDLTSTQPPQDLYPNTWSSAAEYTDSPRGRALRLGNNGAPNSDNSVDTGNQCSAPGAPGETILEFYTDPDYEAPLSGGIRGIPHYPNSRTLLADKSFSIEFWYKDSPDTVLSIDQNRDKYALLFSGLNEIDRYPQTKNYLSFRDFSIYLEPSQGGTRAKADVAGTSEPPNDAAIGDYNWHHYALTREVFADNTSIIRFFVDGNTVWTHTTNSVAYYGLEEGYAIGGYDYWENRLYEQYFNCEFFNASTVYIETNSPRRGQGNFAAGDFDDLRIAVGEPIYTHSFAPPLVSHNKYPVKPSLAHQSIESSVEFQPTKIKRAEADLRTEFTRSLSETWLLQVRLDTNVAFNVTSTIGAIKQFGVELDTGVTSEAQPLLVQELFPDVSLEFTTSLDYTRQRRQVSTASVVASIDIAKSRYRDNGIDATSEAVLDSDNLRIRYALPELEVTTSTSVDATQTWRPSETLESEVSITANADIISGPEAKLTVTSTVDVAAQQTARITDTLTAELTADVGVDKIKRIEITLEAASTANVDPFYTATTDIGLNSSVTYDIYSIRQRGLAAVLNTHAAQTVDNLRIRYTSVIEDPLVAELTATYYNLHRFVIDVGVALETITSVRRINIDSFEQAVIEEETRTTGVESEDTLAQVKQETRDYKIWPQ